jgi:Fur family peroxide stress response transcriptional regulator
MEPIMSNVTTLQRQTKYCTLIVHTLRILGHATNAELLKTLQKSFPELSATTVHRATARLASRGLIGIAPSDKNGSMQYDANVKSHDHFQCNSCGVLKDADVKNKVIPILESSIGDCSISGQLTINGVCQKCLVKLGGKYENNYL